MHTELAARIEQAIHNQKQQYFLPTDGLAPFRQALLPELVQAELMPQLARQPAVAKYARSSQFQSAQFDLHAVQRAVRKLPVIGEQTHRGVSLFVFDENLQ